MGSIKWENMVILLIVKDNAQRGEAQKQKKRLFYLKVVSLEIN